MTDPKNPVNETLDAQRITGIRAGASNGQPGVAWSYYRTSGGSAFLARAILWCWRKLTRR